MLGKLGALKNKAQAQLSEARDAIAKSAARRGSYQEDVDEAESEIASSPRSSAVFAKKFVQPTPETEEEIVAALDERYFTKDFDSTGALMESLPKDSGRELPEGYIEMRLNELDSVKSIIDKRLSDKVMKNYDAFVQVPLAHALPPSRPPLPFVHTPAHSRPRPRICSMTWSWTSQSRPPSATKGAARCRGPMPDWRTRCLGSRPRHAAKRGCCRSMSSPKKLLFCADASTRSQSWWLTASANGFYTMTCPHAHTHAHGSCAGFFFGNLSRLFGRAS